MRIVHHVLSFNARLELPRCGPNGNLQVKKPLRVPVEDFLFDNGRQPRVITEVPPIPGKLAIPVEWSCITARSLCARITLAGRLNSQRGNPTVRDPF